MPCNFNSNTCVQVSFIITTPINPVFSQQEYAGNSLENKEMTYESFFEKVASMDLDSFDNEQVIYITYNCDAHCNTIEFLGFETREPDFFSFTYET
ncbi:MAG: hypothetical protein HRT68_07665 [Flavobacteriaceae bacterium]|nr:hypothetical protein [Flavobacteriaceae bacterium]